MTLSRNKVKTKKLLKPKETSEVLKLQIENGEIKLGLLKKSSKSMKSFTKRHLKRNSKHKQKKLQKQEQLQQLMIILERVNKNCSLTMHHVMMDCFQMARILRRARSRTWNCHQSFPR